MTNDQTQRIQVCEEQIDKLEKTINNYRILSITFILIGFVLIFVFYGLLLNGNKTENDLIDKLGSISGGIVSSTFSLAGLFLVYVAFLGQKQQLLYQQIELIHNKIELELTRSEMVNQQLEMKKQNDTLEVQKFENLFFQLLNSYENTKKSYYIIMDFNRFNDFVNKIQKGILGMHPDSPVTVSSLNSKYDLFKIQNTEFELSFFFQINSILKFIIETQNEAINKELYIDIFKSTLSNVEKQSIYLIYTFEAGMTNLEKEYIGRSNILEGISTKTFCNNYQR